MLIFEVFLPLKRPLVAAFNKTRCYFFLLFFRQLFLKKTFYYLESKISTKSIAIKIYNAHVLYNLH